MVTYRAPVDDLIFLFDKLRTNPHYNELEKYKEVNSDLAKDILEQAAKIILITGNKDESTPAWQAEAYAKMAKKKGLNAQIHIVKGGHSILGKKEVKKIIKEAL